jgi:hypothetical protein
MRRIDIFVSSRRDVRKERAVAERIIRSVAAEFGLPVSASDSNWLRAPDREGKAAAERANGSPAESAFLVCPCFWEYEDWKPKDTYREEIPNCGQYDLLICLLWSQLGRRPAPISIMPDGSEPRSAMHYEIAWVLDQAKRTPGFPALQVYRNRSTSWAPLELSEEPEAWSEQRRLLQEFLRDCQQNDAFVAGCCEYGDLGEFEALFRKHFRDYIVGRLRDDLLPGESPKKVLSWNKNPFRGLKFFNFEDAPFFCGRTKTVGELLDVLQQQAAAEKPFVLVLGPGGSGKTSLVRAGALPILTRVGTTEGEGPWRLALARPAGAGGRDPFETLAAALLKGLRTGREFRCTQAEHLRYLAAQLRERPDSAAVRIREKLDHLGRKALNPFLNEGAFELSLADQQGGNVELAQQYALGRIKPKARLALVVDQLEELFVEGFSTELQQKYLAALGALVRCQQVFVIAILRTDFYAAFRKACPPNELAVLSGSFELDPPSPKEIGEMIRLPAEAIGLRFEREPETGQNLDVALLEAATVNADPLPLLEHALWELCRKQQTRKDGLLRWSDYRESGELENSLAEHAERVFLALGADAQDALKPVIRKLVSIGHGEEARLIGRTVSNRDLVASPGCNHRQKAGAKALIDRFIIEGLFHGETDPDGEILVSIAQESLLRNWPRVCALLDEDLGFLRMRDRLEANLKLWLCKGRRSGDLLRSVASLNDAEALVRGFRGSLSDIQFEYLQKSLKARNRLHRVRRNAVLGVIGGLAVVVAVALGQRNALHIRLKETKAKANQAQRVAVLVAGQRDSFQAQLRDSEAEAQQAQKDSELAASQRDALQAQLKETEAKAQQAQKNSEPPAPPMETTESDSTPIVPPKLETNRSGVEAHRAKSRREEPSQQSLAHPKAPPTKSEGPSGDSILSLMEENVAIERQILATDQRIVSASGKKKEDLKAWKKYLERRRKYVRELRRYEEVALRSKWNE